MQLLATTMFCVQQQQFGFLLTKLFCAQRALRALQPLRPRTGAGAWVRQLVTQWSSNPSTSSTAQFFVFAHRIIRWTHTPSVPEFAPGDPLLRYGAHFRYLRANGCRLVLRISGGCFFSVPYPGCEIFSFGPPWGGFNFSLGPLLGAYFRTALCGGTYGSWMVNFSPNSGTS